MPRAWPGKHKAEGPRLKKVETKFARAKLVQMGARQHWSIQLEQQSLQHCFLSGANRAQAGKLRNGAEHFFPIPTNNP